MREVNKRVTALLLGAAIAWCSYAWAVALAPLGGENLGKVTGGDFKGKGHAVIQKKCTKCHTEQVIKDAIAAGKNMQKIQIEMEKKGAQLSANDRQVLGIFWKSPLKEKK